MKNDQLSALVYYPDARGLSAQSLIVEPLQSVTDRSIKHAQGLQGARVSYVCSIGTQLECFERRSDLLSREGTLRRPQTTEDRKDARRAARQAKRGRRSGRSRGGTFSSISASKYD